MPKASDNFLRGWCRQLRQALDDGTELGYEAAELVEELDELLVPRGDTDTEMGQCDSDGDGADGSDTEGDAQVTTQADLPGIPGVGGNVEHLRGAVRGTSSVPRGTGGGVTDVTPAVPCKRVHRG